MEIMELAAQLGKMIKEDPRIKRFDEVSEKYERDTSIQMKVTEYNAHSAALAEEYKKTTRDEDVIAAIENRMRALYDEITENPLMAEYEEARLAVNQLMEDVNGEITYQVTGQRPCSHGDCASCGGGCDHHH